MRSTRLLMLSLIAATVVAGSAHAQSPGPAVLVPGLWEITVQARTPIVGPLLTHTVCIDKSHLVRPEPPKSRRIDDCQIRPDAAAANETAYTVHCAKKKVTTSSRFTYLGDHFNGTVTITSAEGEQVQQVYAGMRTGDCDDPPDQTPTSPAH